ncbi:L-rhamnose mutarotase [Agrobacterium rhizogenes]|nr:L-rhamnose mutarotase [Rhizobium rhizogenes]NTJ79407.1 L-rhamnose mutarotase [Rhizobium rhizogenes]
MKRYGMVIGLHDEKVGEYKQLHAAVWRGVLATLSENGVRNFTIFLKEPENLLFGTFDYIGEDYAETAKSIAADPITREWWALTEPCQKPLDHRREGEWWAFMENVFHLD